MKLRLAIVLSVALPSLVLALAQEAPKTTRDGVYTEAQSKRGEALYAQSCGSCHAPDLTGADAAPSLTGPSFDSGWNDLSVGDLLERIRTTMPADGPGSLTRDQYVDIVAFLLSKDGCPPGQTDLPAQTEALKQIKIATGKP
jgi:mono/diheme cytochrome c family protein